jgi:flagellar basal-body rod modification protein FlgD
MASIDSISSPASTGATTPATTTSTAAASSSANSQENQFLQLLVAQLQSQNPLDPMDGTQFVTQLAQFSSLQELTGMHTDLNAIQGYLQAAATTNATSPTNSTNPTSSTATSNPSQTL